MKSQGVTEELRCLGLLNALDKNQDIPEDLAQLLGESCIKLAEGIKAYISKVSLHLELVREPKSSVSQPVRPTDDVAKPVHRQAARSADFDSVQISTFEITCFTSAFGLSGKTSRRFPVKLFISVTINVSKQVSHFFSA